MSLMLHAPTKGVHRVPNLIHNRARERVLLWIMASGRSQASIAKEIGRSQAWLSRYLKGVFDPDMTTLGQIAAAFGHDVSALLTQRASAEDNEYLGLLHAVSPEARRNVLAFLRLLAAKAHRRGAR
jgi:transcriptional regulator with XRE-family HTH domain